MAEHLTLAELLEAVEIVDAHIDAATGQPYREQPLALTWARVTKVCEESGEVWRALSNLTGENPTCSKSWPTPRPPRSALSSTLRRTRPRPGPSSAPR